MSDMSGMPNGAIPGGMPDFQSLYTQILQQYPRSTGKTASPQKDMKAAVAWKKMIDGELGFDPTSYESPAKKQYSPKSSAVKVQYGNDPFVSATLSDIDTGAETSSSVAAKLIDPTTGELKPELTGKVTAAQATSAIDAAKAYEKEKAQNTVDQVDYENRQNADPTFGRTPGSTNGKHILPEGDLNGTETPDFSYSQGITDMLKALSDSNGKASLPMAPPVYGHPTEQVGQIATSTNPYGGMQVDTSIHGAQPAASAPQQDLMGLPSPHITPLAADQGRTMTPIMNPATGSFAHHDGGNIFQRLAQGLQHRTPTMGPSDQERAVSGVSAMQDFAQKYAQPVRSQANNAAVQKLLQIMALQG